MKIKRIYCSVAILSKGHTMNFDSDKHKIEYLPEYRAYLIDDNLLIHDHKVNEVIVELEEIPVKQLKIAKVK
jgi:hypothetical protein